MGLEYDKIYYTPGMSTDTIPPVINFNQTLEDCINRLIISIETLTKTLERSNDLKENTNGN